MNTDPAPQVQRSRHISIVNVWILKGNVVQKHFLSSRGPGAQLSWWDGMGGIWKYGHSPLQKILQRIQYIDLISSCIYYSIWQHTMRYPCRCNNAMPLTLSILNQNGILGGNANKKSLGIPHSAPIHHEKKNTIHQDKVTKSGSVWKWAIPPLFMDLCKGKWWLPMDLRSPFSPWVRVVRLQAATAPVGNHRCICCINVWAMGK